MPYGFGDILDYLSGLPEVPSMGDLEDQMIMSDRFNAAMTARRHDQALNTFAERTVEEKNIERRRDTQWDAQLHQAELRRQQELVQAQEAQRQARLRSQVSAQQAIRQAVDARKPVSPPGYRYIRPAAPGRVNVPAQHPASVALGVRPHVVTPGYHPRMTPGVAAPTVEARIARALSEGLTLVAESHGTRVAVASKTRGFFFPSYIVTGRGRQWRSMGSMRAAKVFVGLVGPALAEAAWQRATLGMSRLGW